MADRPPSEIARETLKQLATRRLPPTPDNYLALRLGIEVLKLGSAGLANLLAAPLGIATSFLGNRYFVFQRQDGDLLQQALRFIGLYAAIALLHGSLLYVWSDLLKFNSSLFAGA